MVVHFATAYSFFCFVFFCVHHWLCFRPLLIVRCALWLISTSSLSYQLFELIDEIAQGSYGHVFNAVYLRRNQPCALKIIALEEDESFDDLLLVFLPFLVISTLSNAFVNLFRVSSRPCEMLIPLIFPLSFVLLQEGECGLFTSYSFPD